MPDTATATVLSVKDLESYLTALGFERVEHPIFERQGRQWLVKRPIPPPSDHYPPQEFTTTWSVFPIAVTRYGPKKEKRDLGRVVRKRQASGTLVIVSKGSVWYRKRGIDDATLEELSVFGVRWTNNLSRK
jgi:hypothetical protein